MKEQKFLTINDKIVNSEVLTTQFACDLDKCKGSCCTLESDYGAPLRHTEIAEMEANLVAALQYIPQIHKDVIETVGFYEIKGGELLTTSYNSRACVFVYYDNEIAKCSIEKAYFKGESTFRKPQSCHLFPIRLSEMIGDVLRYERFTGCEPALENGKARQIKLVDFCQEPLERAFGKEWCSELHASIKSLELP